MHKKLQHYHVVANTDIVVRYRTQRAPSAVVLGGDGGAVRQRARAVPALRVGTDPAAAGAAGPAPEGLRTAGNNILL